MANHHYELRYFCEELEVFVKFPGDVDVQELRENLKSFLAGATWNESNIAKLFGEEPQV